MLYSWVTFDVTTGLRVHGKRKQQLVIYFFIMLFSHLKESENSFTKHICWQPICFVVFRVDSSSNVERPPFQFWSVTNFCLVALYSINIATRFWTSLRILKWTWALRAADFSVKTVMTLFLCLPSANIILSSLIKRLEVHRKAKVKIIKNGKMRITVVIITFKRFPYCMYSWGKTFAGDRAGRQTIIITIMSCFLQYTYKRYNIWYIH